MYAAYTRLVDQNRGFELHPLRMYSKISRFLDMYRTQLKNN